MLKYRLPAALASALLVTALGPVNAGAQATATKPAAPAQTPPAQPPVAPAPKIPAPTDVVGSVNGKQMTWDDLIQRLRKDLPAQFTGIAAQAAGAKVASGLFGPDGKPQVTVTQEDIYATIRQNPPPQLSSALDNFLMQDAFKQEADKEGVAVTDKQIQERITKQLKLLRTQGRIQPGQTDDAWLANFLTEQHMTREQLNSNIRQSMVPYALLEKEVVKQLGHPVSPDDFVQIRQILIKAPAITPTSTVDDKKADLAAQTKAQNIAAQVRSGKKTFAQAAKEYNEDFASKKEGGVVAPFMRGGQATEIETEAFKLKPNEVSAPIRTQVGYYLIAIEKQGKEIPDDKREQLLAMREGQMSQSYLGVLRTRANVTNNLRPAGGPGGPGGPISAVPGGPRGAAGQNAAVRQQ